MRTNAVMWDGWEGCLLPGCWQIVLAETTCHSQRISVGPDDDTEIMGHSHVHLEARGMHTASEVTVNTVRQLCQSS